MNEPNLAMEDKRRIRKEYKKQAGRTQKVQSYRIDLDIIEMLKSVANKGRLINDLLREYFRSRNLDESKKDEDPAWGMLEDREV